MAAVKGGVQHLHVKGGAPPTCMPCMSSSRKNSKGSKILPRRSVGIRCFRCKQTTRRPPGGRVSVLSRAAVY